MLFTDVYIQRDEKKGKIAKKKQQEPECGDEE
jgi:hypothetical protein